MKCCDVGKWTSIVSDSSIHFDTSQDEITMNATSSIRIENGNGNQGRIHFQQTQSLTSSD
ncbi:hypothetical protein [Pelagicoccus albus]|uniref:Uncharacterized protein n=1 Tax=Pelagicoccus albus TaxID=415222 RepID=A0A7X1B890_9BACT|nr:hypothetical protein [Pelagicoccus albus]MBC2606223.1 hypothetical protein [Pelagicoccus albus]